MKTYELQPREGFDSLTLVDRPVREPGPHEELRRGAICNAMTVEELDAEANASCGWEVTTVETARGL